MPPSLIRIVREAGGEPGTAAPLDVEGTAPPPPEVAAKIVEATTFLPEFGKYMLVVNCVSLLKENSL